MLNKKEHRKGTPYIILNKLIFNALKSLNRYKFCDLLKFIGG